MAWGMEGRSIFSGAPTKKDIDVCIVGGCGHVGLPLGIAFAKNGANVALLDINEASVKRVNNAEMPFKEEGAEEQLRDVIYSGQLVATTDRRIIGTAKTVVKRDCRFFHKLFE
jgi:UDP-N-acetyl-D-mannosaminuronic acid dehydrogenase